MRGGRNQDQLIRVKGEGYDLVGLLDVDAILRQLRELPKLERAVERGRCQRGTVHAESDLANLPTMPLDLVRWFRGIVGQVPQKERTVGTTGRQGLAVGGDS